MFGLFGGESAVAPATVPTDTIIPLNAGDDNDLLRSVIVVLSYRFDDVLDPQKLRSSFEALLDRPGWRKIGGRLRKNMQGRLEYHIPQIFDETRPIVTYSHASYDMPIAHHPLGARLPRPTQRPSVLADPTEFDDLVCSKDAPRTLNEYLIKDIPQLCLHIASFQDSTLISISLPHTLTDGTGGAQIYKAWALALHGEFDKIAPFHAYDYDPLETFGDCARHEYMNAQKQLPWWKEVIFAGYQLWDAWRYKTESRIMCVPGKVVAELRTRAITELRAATGDKTAFVSDNDVLTAWFTRLCLGGGFFPQPKQTVRIMNALSLASVVSDRWLPPSKAFISNAATEIYTFSTVGDILERPVSETAWAVRRSMMETANEDQVEALQGLKRSYRKRTGRAWPTFGDITMEMMSYSNWTKGRYFETDFSPAIVKEGLPVPQRAEKRGFASMVQFNAWWSTPIDVRNLMPIMGKDAGGNYWLQGPLRKVVWDSITRQLQAGEY